MMARPFSSKNAKQLIRQQADLQEKLESALTEIDDFKAKIYHWAERLSARETLKVLRDIPVEELNRDKKGIRVKTLRENGYSTIADVATSTVYQLAAISGISEEGARTIKRIAAALSSKASQDLKIHLSLDNKTEEAGELLLAILKYQKGLAYKKECQSLLFKYADKVEKAIKDLSIARSSFHWFFASKTKKQAAQVAYAYLQRLLNSQDHNEAETILTKLSQIKALSVDFAWQKFGENPITFTNALDSYVPGLLGTRDTSYGLPEDLAREIQDECFFPDGLLCQLRTYQEWGVKFALHQEKVLLGDEMGLGKTIQAIATMVSLKNTGATHFMVIAPAGVLTNW